MAAKRKTKSVKKTSFKLGKVNITPAPGYLVIKPEVAETKTAAGIYLPESTEEKPQKGKVVAVGADEVSDYGTVKESPAKVGDMVIFKKWGGNEVKISNIEYLFSKFEDVLAVVK